MPVRPVRHRADQPVRRLKRHRLRPSSTACGYDRRWRRLARMVRAKQPFCADPFGVHAALGRRVAAECVDHIVPRRQGGADHESNLQPLCLSCHARKTVYLDGGFGRTPAGREARAGDTGFESGRFPLDERSGRCAHDFEGFA